MANTEDSSDSLDGLIILVLELVVLKITNEKWADRIHFVQFNSEYGTKENIIKVGKENRNEKIKLEISSYYCCRDSCSCHDRRIRSAEFTK